MSNRYKTGHPTQTQGGSLIFKIALGIVFGSIILWGIGIVMGIGTLAIFAKAFEQVTNQNTATAIQALQPRISQLDLGQPGKPNTQPSFPLSPEAVFKNMGDEAMANSQRIQMEMAKRIREQKNIADANEIYHQRHPNMPRIKTPEINFNNIAQSSPQNDTDDTDPHSNPSAWDSIQSKDKICWFHKTTRRKICENNH